MSGVLPGEEFFTDANSLTMVKRVRGLRSAFAAAPLADEHTANPIGGNYHPVTSAIYLRDAASGRQLSLITDRGQGAPRRQLQPAISWPDAGLHSDTTDVLLLGHELHGRVCQLGIGVPATLQGLARCRGVVHAAGAAGGHAESPHRAQR